MTFKKCIYSFIIFSLIFNVFISPSFAQFSFNFEPPTPEYTADIFVDELILKSSVSILLLTDEGMGTCSGTIVYEDEKSQYILTAKHCLDVEEEIYIEEKPVVYTMTSADDDLALLVINEKIINKIAIDISPYQLELNEEVYHIGYPREIVYKASGHMTHILTDWQTFDFQAIGGCSGGGIFNKYGYLVGVLWGGYNDAPTEAKIKSIAEPVNDIKRFLKTVLPNAFK